MTPRASSRLRAPPCRARRIRGASGGCGRGSGTPPRPFAVAGRRWSRPIVPRHTSFEATHERAIPDGPCTGGGPHLDRLGRQRGIHPARFEQIEHLFRQRLQPPAAGQIEGSMPRRRGTTRPGRDRYRGTGPRLPVPPAQPAGKCHRPRERLEPRRPPARSPGAVHEVIPGRSCRVRDPCHESLLHYHDWANPNLTSLPTFFHIKLDHAQLLIRSPFSVHSCAWETIRFPAVLASSAGLPRSLSLALYRCAPISRICSADCIRGNPRDPRRLRSRHAPPGRGPAADPRRRARSSTRAAWSATPTPTWCCTPSPTPCSAPPASATSATPTPTPTRAGRTPTRGCSSRETLARLNQRGLAGRQRGRDVFAQEPKLGPVKAAIRDNLARLLGAAGGRGQREGQDRRARRPHRPRRGDRLPGGRADRSRLATETQRTRRSRDRDQSRSCLSLCHLCLCGQSEDR